MIMFLDRAIHHFKDDSWAISISLLDSIVPLRLDFFIVLPII